MTQGGAIASRAGLSAEAFIEGALRLLGPVQRKHWIGLGIYGTETRVDFYLPTVPLIVESKWQDSKGTADEKLPFLAENILTIYPCKTIVIVGGSGARPGAIAWLRAKLQDSQHEVMVPDEFMTWFVKSQGVVA